VVELPSREETSFEVQNISQVTKIKLAFEVQNISQVTKIKLDKLIMEDYTLHRLIYLEK